MRHRVVLDTNVLVAAAYAPASASRAIVEACLHGDLEAIVSAETVREHRYILGRAVRSGDYLGRLELLLSGSTLVVPEQTPRHVPEDAGDDKFLAVALAGQAGWIVSNDKHLLGLDPYWEVRIVRPGEFAELTKLAITGEGGLIGIGSPTRIGGPVRASCGVPRTDAPVTPTFSRQGF